MENYIVRIENQEEWKKVVAKALAVGFKWQDGGDLEEDTYTHLLEDEEDVFLFLNGTDHLDNEHTDPMTIQWDTMISTDDDYNYDHYKEVSADKLSEKLSKDEDTVKNYIVKVTSRKQWKKVAKKALKLGYTWVDGTTKANSYVYDMQQEDVFYLFLHGTKNLDSKKRGKMQLSWYVSSEEGDNRYNKYERLDAKDFLSEDQPVKNTNPDDFKQAVLVKSEEEWEAVFEKVTAHGGAWQDGDKESSSDKYDKVHENLGSDVVLILNAEGLLSIGSLKAVEDVGLTEHIKTVTAEEFLNSDLERFENVDQAPQKKRVFLVPIGSPEDRDKVTEKAKKDNWEPFVSERIVDEFEALQRAATYIGFYYDTAGEGVRSYLSLDDGAADMFRDKYGKDVVEEVPLDSFLAMEEADDGDDDELVQALVSLFEQLTEKGGNND